MVNTHIGLETETMVVFGIVHRVMVTVSKRIGIKFILKGIHLRQVKPYL